MLVEGKEVRAKQEPPGGARSAELIKSRTKSRSTSRTWFYRNIQKRGLDGSVRRAKESLIYASLFLP